MFKSKIYCLLSTTAVLFGINTGLVVAMQSSPQPSLLAPTYATLSGPAKIKALNKAYADLELRAKSNDENALVAIQAGNGNKDLAIKTYDAAVTKELTRQSLGNDLLTKGESRALDVMRKVAGGTEEGLEKLASQIESGGIYGEIKQDAATEELFENIDSINSKLDFTSKLSDTITFPVIQYNLFRKSAGLTPVTSNADTVKVSREDAQDLIESLARKIALTKAESKMGSIDGQDPDAQEEVSLGKKMSLFLRNFPNLGETPEDDQLRDVSLEDIMTLMLLEPEGKEPFYNKLRFALEEFKTSSAYSQRLNKYAEYYEAQISVNPFNKFNDAFENEKDRIAKNEMLDLAGLCWNEIMPILVNYTQEGTIYTDQETPLLTLISRRPEKFLQLLDSQRVQFFQELIKYTPYKVVGAVYSALNRSGIKEKEASGPSGKIVSAINSLLSVLEDALGEAERNALSQPSFQKSLNSEFEKIKRMKLQSGQAVSEKEINDLAKINVYAAARDANLANRPEKFNSLKSIISNQDLISKYQNIDAIKLGKYSSTAAKKEAEERKAALVFKLNQKAKAGYIGSAEEQEAVEKLQREAEERRAEERKLALENERREMAKGSAEKDAIKRALTQGVKPGGGSQEDPRIVEERMRKQRELIATQKAENERKDSVIKVISQVLQRELENLQITLNMGFITDNKNRSILFRKIFDETKGKSNTEILAYINNNKSAILNTFQPAESIPEEIQDGIDPQSSTNIVSPKPAQVVIKGLEDDAMRLRVANVLPKLKAATGKDFILESLNVAQVNQIKKSIDEIENESVENLTSIITQDKLKGMKDRRYTSLAGPLNQ